MVEASATVLNTRQVLNTMHMDKYDALKRPGRFLKYCMYLIKITDPDVYLDMILLCKMSIMLL